MGRCGGLIEIVQEKPAKVFPAHTLFLAAGGKNSQPPPMREAHQNKRSGRAPANRPKEIRGMPAASSSLVAHSKVKTMRETRGLD